MDNLITIYITTGRIQVQGKVIKEWGNSEFVSLVKIVDSKSELNLQISTQQLHESLDELKKVNENVKKDRNKSNGCTTETSPIDTPTTQTTSMNEATTPREKCFNMIKMQVASLESDVVNFKQEISKSLENVMETLKQKDNKLNLLNEKIGQAHSNETVMKQTISDLTLKQYEQQQEIDKLKHMNKNQQQQLKELKTKLNNIPHNNDPSEPQMKSPGQKSKSWASDKPSKQTSTIPEEPSESSPESSSTQKGMLSPFN